MDSTMTFGHLGLHDVCVEALKVSLKTSMTVLAPTFRSTVSYYCVAFAPFHQFMHALWYLFTLFKMPKGHLKNAPPTEKSRSDVTKPTTKILWYFDIKQINNKNETNIVLHDVGTYFSKSFSF